MENTQENRLSAKSALCDNLKTHDAIIQDLEKKYGRKSGSVSLLAVSKRKPVEMVVRAQQCGQTAFGENYAQELEQKASVIQSESLQWHFIGPIQSNKTQIIATHADWVHSLDRVKIAKRLSEQRPEGLPSLQICIQVNLDQETTKSGISIPELEQLCDEVSALNHITIRGLMCIPVASSNFEESRRSFEKLRLALESLNRLGHNLDTLSMGMSGDFEAAIAEGATIIRIGTAIFGQRG